MNIIGIDPGLSGGLAMVGRKVIVAPMPILPDHSIDTFTLVDWVNQFIRSGDETVYIEELARRSSSGSTRGGMTAADRTTIRNHGEITGALKVFAIHYVIVDPKTWKSTVLAGFNWHNSKVPIMLKTSPNKGKMRVVKNTKAAEEFCAGQYPRVNLLASPRCTVPHSGMADALCIAHYGKMMKGE